MTNYECAGLTHCSVSKAFIEYSNNMDVIYENIKEHDPNKERKTLMMWLLISLVMKNITQ